MDKTGVHESKASNLLKLNYKINNEIVGCSLDSWIRSDPIWVV
jgi:hypothetical protein